MMSPDTPAEILRHYTDNFAESERLGDGVERLRTQELILRFIPNGPATVLDVGGGPGIYARWLALLGHQVHLIDPVPLHVEQAGAIPGLASAEVGDARNLNWPDASVDLALLLGPLYHLTDRVDRIQALREAHRVLRPGGRVLVAAISRFASAMDGVLSGFVADDVFREIVDRDLTDGQHRPPGDDPRYFTTSFFHHPSEIGEEIREAGFDDVAVLAVESFAGLMADFPSDAELRTRILDIVRRVESEPSLLGASPHLIGVGTRSSHAATEPGLPAAEAAVESPGFRVGGGATTRRGGGPPR